MLRSIYLVVTIGLWAQVGAAAAATVPIRIQNSLGLSRFDLDRRILVNPPLPARQAFWRKDGQWQLSTDQDSDVRGLVFEMKRVRECGLGIVGFVRVGGEPTYATGWDWGYEIELAFYVGNRPHLMKLEPAGPDHFKGQLEDYTTGRKVQATLTYKTGDVGFKAEPLVVGTHATPFVRTDDGVKRFFVPKPQGGSTQGLRISHAGTSKTLLCSASESLMLFNDGEKPMIVAGFDGHGASGVESMMLVLDYPVTTRIMPASGLLSLLRAFPAEPQQEAFTIGMDYFVGQPGSGFATPRGRDTKPL